jgi:FlaA1/EpsC-like NDP-sugar epimerase
MIFGAHVYWRFLLQSLAVCAALLLAWLLRYDFVAPGWRFLQAAIPVLLCIRWMGMGARRLTYENPQYSDIRDGYALLGAILAGSAAFYAVLRFGYGMTGVPLSVFVMEGILSFLLLGALKLVLRIPVHVEEGSKRERKAQVLIAGAGSAALQLLKALPGTSLVAVGLVDDDPSKRGLRLAGVPVVGGIAEIPALSARFEAAEVLIAIPSASSSEMIRIADACAQARVRFRTVPTLAELVNGTYAISEFRDFNLDELLGREPVRLESQRILARLEGEVVLVTGAAGSIGSELCRQIARCQPARLICVDRAETPLFHLQQHVLCGAESEIVYSVVDYTDHERMRQLLMEYGVRVIFHAAAHKHVPMTESNPYEGLKNNVFGLMRFVDIADRAGCTDFLLISSDKAVHPGSLMGCTKRLGEMIVGTHESARMRCVSVRFGNVLGSQGSVVPLFRKQIQTQQMVTVTDPRMTRYFMTISEAVSLVLEAFTIGEQGNILVLDMGAQVRILDLAKTLIRLSGKREDEISIVYTGIRPGEKLHEELFYNHEERLPTPAPKVMRAHGHLPPKQVLRQHLQELEFLRSSADTNTIRAKIKQIIPEYQWEPAQAREVESCAAQEARFMHPSTRTQAV